MLHQRLQHLGQEEFLSAEQFPAGAGPIWVCVGPKTALALQKLGRQPDLQPEEYRAEAIIDLLVQRGISGQRVLYPRAQLARPLIPQQLRAAGAIVDDPVAYNTIPGRAAAEQIRQLMRTGALDVVTFTSSSTVENFVAALGDDAVQLTRDLVVASIGPLTSATARRLGLTVTVEAQDYTLEGLLAALVTYYQLLGKH
jgi:uroporphyrinogen III methyltransferase/synthase